MQYITKYKAEWPQRFKQIAEFISPFLPDNCKVHHIGSTSVPGMPAKDIIDLDIEHPNGYFQMVVSGLTKAGYEHAGDLGIAGRESFKPVQGSKAASLPIHHLYACESGAYELIKHIAYREYLITHSDRARWLATQKIAVDASAESRDSYILNKSPYYSVITSEALKWAMTIAAMHRKKG